MPVQTAAGSQLSIGTDTVSAPDPVVDSYTNVAEVVEIPEFGRVYEVVLHNPIDNRKTFKFKGSYNDGSFAIGIGRDVSDAGQAAMLATLDSDLTYNLRIQLNDDPDNGSGSAPTTYYIPAKVMSFPTNIGTVNSIVSATVNIEVDGDITEVAPVQGV